MRIIFTMGPTDVKSSRVKRVGFARDARPRSKNSGIAIEFTNGFRAFYPGTDSDDYHELVSAASVGRTFHERYEHLPYVEVEA